QIWLRRSVRGCPPGRREEPRQGADLQLPRSQSPLGPQAPAPRVMVALQREEEQGREHPRLSSLELDRARRLAIYPQGGDRDRAPLFRGRAADGGARRR